MKREKRGGILPTKSGKWACKWYFEGKQQWKTFRTKKEAERFKARTFTEIEDGTYKPIKDIAFDKFATKWLAEKKETVRPSTYDFYRPVTNSLISFFESNKLRAIDFSLCKDYVKKKKEQAKLSNKTIGYHVMVLRQILAEAIREGYLKQNPAEYVKRPKAAKKEFPILSAEELQRFLNHVDSRYRLLFEVAALLGLRRGEVLGLTWEDIDLEEGTLTVSHSLQRVESADKAKRKRAFSLVEPKTEKARRTLSLPSYLVTEMKKHKLQSPPNDLNLVFTTEKGQPLNGDWVYKRQFLPAIDAAELPKVRLHDLRHGYASYAPALGQDLASVSARLGHSSPTVTLSTYTHVIKRLQNEQAEEIAGALLGTSALVKAVN
jgi:integrase